MSHGIVITKMETSLKVEKEISFFFNFQFYYSAHSSNQTTLTSALQKGTQPLFTS